jgi:hypothetical protein
MNLEKLSHWIGILANFGVVLGFVLIAFQLQQNSQALRIQAEAISSSAIIGAESSFMGEDIAIAYAIAVKNPKQLSDAQILQVWGYLSTSLVSGQTTYLAYKRGDVSEADWSLAKSATAQLIDWPFGRLWWSTASNWYPEEMVSEIDVALSELRVSDSVVKQLEIMSEGIKGL